jgi:hypothetical protein
MKTFLSVVVGFAIALSAVASSLSSGRAVSSSAPLYVVIDTTWPAGFDVYRYSRVTGTEFLLTTLRAEAERQAEFAGLNRSVVVPDENASLPDGANVLRLTWADSAVLANYQPAGSKATFLGVVSGYRYAFHPDHRAMEAAVRSNMMPDPHADAQFRAQLQMYLYESFHRLAKIEQ